MQLHHHRKLSVSHQPQQRASARKNKSMSSETIDNFNRQGQKFHKKIDRLQTDDQQKTAPLNVMIKRKSQAQEIKPLDQLKKTNFSQIHRKKQKSDLGRFRTTISRPKTSSKQEKEHQEISKTINTNYFEEDSYKTIHKQFIQTLQEHSRKKQWQAFRMQEESIFVPERESPSLPFKDPEYFRHRLSEMKNSSFSSTDFSVSMKNSAYLFNSGFFKENKNEFQDAFEEIGRKIANQQYENPGTIIYNHYNNKYRNYYTLKTKQLTENSKMHKKLQKQQSTILSNLKEQGLSQQSRLRVLSHFCDTCLHINGLKPKNEQNQLKSRVRTFQKKKHQ